MGGIPVVDGCASPPESPLGGATDGCRRRCPGGTLSQNAKKYRCVGFMQSLCSRYVNFLNQWSTIGQKGLRRGKIMVKVKILCRIVRRGAPPAGRPLPVRAAIKKLLPLSP